jgi:hypothetical protein
MRKKRAKKLKLLAQSIMANQGSEEIKKMYRRLKKVKRA